MRQRTNARRSQTATITRRQQVDTNELGEPLYDDAEVAADVPCSFSDESTSFVREDSGERVQRPATVRFGHDIDVEEGDTVTINGTETPSDDLEVRGVDRRRDNRRGRVQSVVVEVERA